jgi:hypothetical protein
MFLRPILANAGSIGPSNSSGLKERTGVGSSSHTATMRRGVDDLDAGRGFFPCFPPQGKKPQKDTALLTR